MRTTGFRKEVKEDNGIDNELITITGIVIPVDWDEEGNALAAAISSPDEQEYFIKQDAKGKELVGLMRQEIEVSGVVRKGIKGRKTVTVKNYRLKTGGDPWDVG
jgi:hypothetical protein